MMDIKPNKPWTYTFKPKDYGKTFMFKKYTFTPSKYNNKIILKPLDYKELMKLVKVSKKEE